ncbi:MULTISPECIES: hypothetical protein [Rhizobium]|uniref:hypothetical protein n=1 Tax=Rhizobium TaxID=379 RepID=UPI000402071D|nr:MULTISPECIES: hypothetical protein [Rhizobium]UFS81545.1 hypothetical protein LPB79_25065 [Rhizobium sp. T136]
MGDDVLDMQKVFYDERIPLERKERWQELALSMPYIPVRGDWKVRILPPTMGAIARFHVMRGEAHVSIYYDEYCRLGGWNEGYWEIWPDADEDNARFGKDDADELADAIEKSLETQEAKPVVDALIERIKAMTPDQRCKVERFCTTVVSPPIAGDIFNDIFRTAFTKPAAGVA